MKTKLSAVALIASAVTIAQANPGGVHAVTGTSPRGAVARSAPAVHAPMRPGGVSSFRSTPIRSYGSRPFYSGQRHTSFGMRSSPSSAVPAAFLFESRFVYALGSVHRSNYPATQSCRAIRESQKLSCHTRVEPAKHRNAIPEWKQSAEREQYSECQQSPERKPFPKWKQSYAARLAKTRFRSPIRELASRLEPQLRPLVEWPPMLLH